MKVTWPQALAWRMRRQLIDPLGDTDVVGVVRRLGGAQAQVASTAELGIRLRQRRSQAGDVAAALAAGRIMKTWAARGTLHLLTPVEGAAVLSLLAVGRSWEAPAWQRWFGMTTHRWTLFRSAVSEALEGGAVLTREELIAAVTTRRGLRQIGEELSSGWGTLFKPLAWQGDLCFGPNRGTRVTFMRPADTIPGWQGLPDAEEAAPRVVADYLRAYGPATPEAFGAWLSRGRVPKRQLRSWFDRLGDRLAQVDVEGEPMFVLAEDLDDLAATAPSPSVRLLAGFDGWVLGPGTQDQHVVPPGRRWDVSRQSGWIAPIVVSGGVVSGTWAVDGGRVPVDWFREAGRPPRAMLTAEVERLASILGSDLDLAVRPVGKSRRDPPLRQAARRARA